MKISDLITFETAAAQLKIAEPDLYDLIDAGKLTTHRDHGDVFLNAKEVAALAHSRQPNNSQLRTHHLQAVNHQPSTRHHQPATPCDPLSRIRHLKASGAREVSATEAADLLGVGPRQIQHLMREGRLNSEKRGRHRYIDIMEVEFYAMDQAHWASRSGRWTPYGKQEKPDPASGLNLKSPSRERSPNHPITQSPDHPISDDYLLLTKDCATILNVCEGYCRHLCRKHGIKPVRIKRDTGLRNALGLRHVAAPAAYSARAIYALAEKLEAKRNRGNFTPRQWRDLSARPIIRTKIEAPPNDALVTRAEAAAILETSVGNVCTLVGKGRLFGWQKIPGRSGCPLYLSLNQVSRYAKDPQRLKRREASLGRRGTREPSPPGQETNLEIWREEAGLTRGMERTKKPTSEYDHGEFFNTRQVAKLLEVSTSAVRILRQRGRLSGFQKPRVKEDGAGNKWWFYKKDEIYNLLADGEYLRRRDRSRRAKLLGIGRAVPRMETEW